MEGRHIRELFDRLLSPLAQTLARVHPNTITVVSLLTGCLAGVAYWLTTRSTALFFAGGALVGVSGVADGLDGLVARRFGKTSQLGDFLDHFFDRLIEIAILAGLAFSPHANATLGLAVAILVVLNSYLGTQIEASFGTRYYTGLGKVQLFVGLILCSVLLGLFPDAAIPIAGRRFALVNVFFVLAGLGTLQAMSHRLVLARRLATEAAANKTNSEPPPEA